MILRGARRTYILSQNCSKISLSDLPRQMLSSIDESHRRNIRDTELRDANVDKVQRVPAEFVIEIAPRILPQEEALEHTS